MAVINNKTYESYTEEEILRMAGEMLTPRYNSFEEFKEDLIKNIEIAQQQIREGKGIPFEQFMAELEDEFHLND